MPYVKQEQRDLLDAEMVHSTTPGELNYMITNMCIRYTRTMGESYQSYNDIIGALECAKQEFYRKMVVPYENKKCDLNGEVYN